jgi:hypothetical protein
VTGVRSSQTLDNEQQRVLNAWVRIPKSTREWLLTAIELAADKLSEEQTKNETSQALTSASEVVVEKPWLPIPGRVMPGPKGNYEVATMPDSAAPRIKGVVRLDADNKKSRK